MCFVIFVSRFVDFEIEKLIKEKNKMLAIGETWGNSVNSHRRKTIEIYVVDYVNIFYNKKNNNMTSIINKKRKLTMNMAECPFSKTTDQH